MVYETDNAVMKVSSISKQHDTIKIICIGGHCEFEYFSNMEDLYRRLAELKEQFKECY